MELQDADTIESFNDLIGFTIMRVICNYTMDPTYGTFDGVDDEATHWAQVGFGVTNEAAPLQALWDPNDPHEQFMWRGVWGERVSKRNSIALVAGHGRTVLTADSTQRRIIQENHKLWNFVTWFRRLGGTGDVSLSIGFTGRVLVAVP